MGYESKLYIGTRLEIRDEETNEVRFRCFITETTFKLGKLWSDDFRQNSKVFNIPIDFKISEYEIKREIDYAAGTGTITADIVDEIDEDKYGDHLCYGTPEDVLMALKKIDEKYPYALYKRVIAYLENLCNSKHEDIVVVHYGY